MIKLSIPTWVQPKYYPLYPDHAANIGTGHGKILTTHIFTEGVSADTMQAKGFSHIAGLGAETDEERKRRCFTPLADFRDGSGAVTHNPNETSARNFANSLSGNFTKMSVFIDEFQDGSGAIFEADYFTVANWFYNQLCIQLGSSGQADNNFFGIYMDPYSNFLGNNFNPPSAGRNPTASYFKNKFASQAEARKDAGGNLHGYFSSGMYQWSNTVISAYYSVEAINNDWLYHKIAEGQVKYAAMPGMKTVIYSWTGTQSVTTDVDNWSGSDGWKHPREGGYWLAKDFMVNLPYNILCAAFFGMCFFEGYYGWDATLILSRDESDLKDNYFPGRTVWVNTGSPSPGLPAYDAPGNAYPNVPRMGEDLVVVAAEWYTTIKPYVDASTGWAYAAYTANGNSVGVRPGDPRLFRRGYANYGQDTILYLAAAEVGAAFVCQGGGKTVITYTNPYLTCAETENVTVAFNSQNFPLGQCAGSTLHVFIF